MKRILALHPKKISMNEFDNEEGEYPIHLVVRVCPLNVMEFLLDLYPEAARLYNAFSLNNLLHIAVRTRIDKDAKVRYLCSRYPEVSETQY